MSAPDLTAAAAAVELAKSAVDRGAAHLAAAGDPDDHQVALYDLAHAASAHDGAVVVDVPDACAGLAVWLASAGFVRRRSFTRMVRGGASGIGDPP